MTTRVVTTDVAALRRLISPAGRDVLDVGCGDGVLVRGLACGEAAARRVIGLEVSDAQLAAARAATDSPQADEGAEAVAGCPRASYCIGRAEALPLPAASVDLVVFLRSLHHVEPDHMPDAFAEAARVLRPGGAVYVAEPLNEGSFHALVSIVEDEDEVRAAAQAAVAGAGTVGLRRIAEAEYDVGSVIADVAGFQRQMLRVDSARAPAFAERDAELQRTFARLGVRQASGARWFTQAMRADVLSGRR